LRRCARAQHGQTPLSWAAEKSHAVVRLLLERGAVVDAKDKVRSPVVPRSVGGCAAKHSGNAPFVASVSAARRRSTRALAFGGRCTLCTSGAYRRARRGLRHLRNEVCAAAPPDCLARAVSPPQPALADAADYIGAQYGYTPLHYAASNGQLECARLLLERGADKEAKEDVRAPTLVTAAARCVGARRVRRFVGRGLRSANSRAVSASAARAARLPRARAFVRSTLRACGVSRRAAGLLRSFGGLRRRFTGPPRPAPAEAAERNAAVCASERR
jgi:hypothetical protein